METPEAMRAALSKRRWDIAISDYTMPHFRGTDALAIVRKSDLDVPFIFVSGTMEEGTAIGAMRAGAHHYITKGDLKQLVPTVERELREAELRRERRRIEEHIKRQQDRIRVLHDINVAINSTLDLRSVLDLLVEKIDLLLFYPVATTLKLLNSQTGELEPVARGHLDETVWKVEGWRSGRDLAQVVFDSKAPLLISDIQTNVGLRDPAFYRQRGLVSYMGIPLIAEGQVLGVLGLYAKKEQEFGPEEIEFLTMLVREVALAIRNCQLYVQTQTRTLELEKACRAESELLGVISRELRTPISAVVGYVALVMDGCLGAVNLEQRKALARVMGQVHELLTLIESLVEAGRMEAAVVETEYHEVQLSRFLDQLRSAYEIPLHKEVIVSWKYPPELPTIIKVDVEKLKHILKNLIDHAIKFTDRGRVTISARHFPEKGSVEFKVSDSGKGISRESQPFVFEMSSPSDSLAGWGRGRIGAGLHVVKRFTEILGGRIEVESKPGKGSTFTLIIPCEANGGFAPSHTV